MRGSSQSSRSIGSKSVKGGILCALGRGVPVWTSSSSLAAKIRSGDWKRSSSRREMRGPTPCTRLNASQYASGVGAILDPECWLALFEARTECVTRMPTLAGLFRRTGTISCARHQHGTHSLAIHVNLDRHFRIKYLKTKLPDLPSGRSIFRNPKNRARYRG